MSDTNLPDNRRKALEDENRNCVHCGGSGMCLVYHPRHNGGREITIEHNERLHKIATEIAGHCKCPVGVWIRERTEPAVQRRIPWVQDILDDRSKWLLFPPSEIQSHAGEVPNQAPTRAAIAGRFGRIPETTA